MGLPETRKILSIIISVITAISTFIVIAAFVFGNTATSLPFVDKVMFSGNLTTACEEQLDMKYTVLEAETGIPKRVFDRVKSDYKVEDVIKSELTKAFNNEEPTPYEDTMVEYFTRLCTEFLDGSEIKYSKDNIKQTAIKAAKIYGDTVGLRNTEHVSGRINSLKNKCSKAELGAVMLIFLGMLILAILYAEKIKGATFWLAGIAGGAAGASIASAVCIIAGVWNKISIEPAAVADAVRKTIITCTALIIPAGGIIFIVSIIALFLMFRKIDKKNERAIVV